MKYYIYSILLASLVFSCSEDIIDIDPETSVTKNIALQKVAGIDAVVRSAYNRMHDFNYYGQVQMLAPEALADNLVIANNTGRYTGHVVNAVGTHVSIWGRYSTINDCNLAIKYVDAAEGDQALKDQYKGEAYFLRAFVYHDLVKTYGYEPGKEVSGWNEGVILRTEPTETVSNADLRARATVEEVYTQIESDLQTAIGLLPAESAQATANKGFRASKAAAKALLARVYLFWGKPGEANTYATQALAETSKSIVPAASYVASWAQTQHPESIFESEIRSADWGTTDGVNNSLASITNAAPTGIAAGSSQFAVAGSKELIDAIEPGDVRADVWVENAGRWECKKWLGEKGDYLENIPLIRVSEVVLIAAEARALSGDEGGAQTILNALRSNRGLTDTFLTGQALLDLILNERRVELAFEGHRWYDLKRLEKDIVKPASLNTNTVPYSDYRMLAPLPSNEVTLNKLLQQNPKY